MAEYTPKEGAGSLFQNRKKEKDSHPDERGDAMIGGVLHEVSAWIKTDRNGNQFRSLSIKPKKAREPNQEPTWEPSRHAQAASRDGADFDDDVPF